MTREEYIARFKHLDEQYRYAWLPLHEDISEYLLPRRGNFIDHGKPYEKNNVIRSTSILNDTASRANRMLGSGMQGGLCSPSQRWFALTLKDKNMMMFGPVKDWLRKCEDIMYSVYATGNFYTEIHRVFEEQAGFGTAPIIQEEDFDSVVNFTVFTAGEYRLASDRNNRVDTCYRHFWMTADQIIKTFGEGNCSDSVKNAYKKTPFEYFEILHCIEPNSKSDDSKADNTKMKYTSVWMEYQDGGSKFLRQSGYTDNPLAVPRWTPVGNSPYGLGPGHDAIGNIKMLQQMEKSIVKAVHKEVDPPMAVSSKLKDVLSLLPGATNWFDGDDSRFAVSPLLNIQFNLHNAEDRIVAIESRIERTFYNDLFAMIVNADQHGRQITATEILERKQEKLVLLGPTVERQTFELLQPINSRTFNICLRLNMFPPPPPELQGQALNIEYLGVLAQAQKLVKAQSMEAYLGEAERVLQLDPMTSVKTDWAAFLEQYADILGVPSGIVRTEDQASILKQQIIQKQQEAEKAQQMQMAVAAMKDLGRADTTGGNVLSDVAEEATNGSR